MAGTEVEVNEVADTAGLIDRVSAEVARRIGAKHASGKGNTTFCVCVKLRYISSINFVVTELSVRPYVEVALADLKPKRRKFSLEEKWLLLQLLRKPVTKQNFSGS